MYCSKCGAAMADGAVFCPNCGQAFSIAAVARALLIGGVAPLSAHATIPRVWNMQDSGCDSWHTSLTPW